MNYRKIDRTIAEAQRFINLAGKARNSFLNENHEIGPYKEVAAMKRASMDLTRALAELRNPNVR